MFGASIERTLGEVAGDGMKLMNVGIKVHKLGGGREKAVGVELVAKSFASYQMIPVTLSAAEAKKLIAFLEKATEQQGLHNKSLHRAPKRLRSFGRCCACRYA